MIAIALWPEWWGADQAVFIVLVILVLLIAILVPIGPVGSELPPSDPKSKDQRT